MYTPRLEIIVASRANEPQGDGPIANVPWVRYSRVLNGLGSFSTLLPLRDPKTDLLQIKKNRIWFIWGEEFKFSGTVESIGKAVREDGTLLLPVSGRCHGADLAEARVNFLDLSFGGSGTMIAPSEIVSEASFSPGGGTTPNLWSVSNTPPSYSSTLTSIYAKFAGESAVQALNGISEKIGENWRIDESGDNTVIWLREDMPPSGVRAIQGAPDMEAAQLDDTLCFFQTWEEVSNAYDMFNRIYPYGAGNYDIAPTLSATNRTSAAGYVLNKTENYIDSTGSISDVGGIGFVIPVYMQFPDIRPISNTDADQLAASNLLFDSALNALKSNDFPADFTEYKLGRVVGLPDAVVVGTTLHIVYDDERYSVDRDMLVHGIDTTIGSDGGIVHDLTLRDVTGKVAASTDTQAIGNALQSGQVWQTHPVVSPNSYELSIHKPIMGDIGDGSEDATIYFDFDDEVLQVQSVLFKFESQTSSGNVALQLLPLESTVLATGTSGGTIGAGTSHSHAIPNHQHNIRIIGNGAGALTNNIGFGAAGTAGGVRHNIDTNDYIFPTTSDSGGTTSEAEDVHTHSFTGDVSNAYGVHRESDANTFTSDNVSISVNGGTAITLNNAVNISGNRYYIDITSQLHDADTLRPLQANNSIVISGSTDGSKQSATIDGSLKIRTIIQTTAVL